MPVNLLVYPSSGQGKGTTAPIPVVADERQDAVTIGEDRILGRQILKVNGGQIGKKMSICSS